MKLFKTSNTQNFIHRIEIGSYIKEIIRGKLNLTFVKIVTSNYAKNCSIWTTKCSVCSSSKTIFR